MPPGSGVCVHVLRIYIASNCILLSRTYWTSHNLCVHAMGSKLSLYRGSDDTFDRVENERYRVYTTVMYTV